MTSQIETVQGLTEIIQRIKTKIANAIEELRQQNPNITSVANTPRVFSMSSAFVSDNCVLDPFYYDWDAQYDAILEKLKKSTLVVFVKSLNELVNTGKLDGRRYHPEVTKRMSILAKEV